jgi:hypothetical protein
MNLQNAACIVTAPRSGKCVGKNPEEELPLPEVFILDGACHANGDLGIEGLAAALPDRAPAQIRHAKLQWRWTNNPDLGHSHYIAVPLQYEAAEISLSPTDSAVRGRLIDVRVFKPIEHLRPFGTCRAINFDLPTRGDQIGPPTFG